MIANKETLKSLLVAMKRGTKRPALNLSNKQNVKLNYEKDTI